MRSASGTGASTPVDGTSSPELPLARRIAVAGWVEAAGGLADVVGLIHQGRWSGTLRVYAGSVRREIRFDDGEVTCASSDRREDRLGELLYQYGRVSRTDIEAALTHPGRPRIGQALIERRLLNAHDVFSFVRKQVEEIFYAVLRLRDGHYEFERGPLPRDANMPDLGLSTQRLLLDGARLADELEFFRQRIPSSDAVPVRTVVSRLEPLSGMERLVLSLVNGERTVAEVGRESQLGEFEATRALFQLIEAGHAEIPRDTLSLEAASLGNVDAGAKELVDIFNPLLEKVATVLGERPAPATFVADVGTFAATPSFYSELFVGITPDASGRVPTIAILANLERVDVTNRRSYLRHAFGELLSFLLFVVGDSLGSDRQRELIRHLVAQVRAAEQMRARDVKETIPVWIGGKLSEAVLAPDDDLEGELV